MLQSRKIAEGTAADNWASKQKVAALIVLRTLSPAAYRELANKGDAYSAIAAMNRALTDDPSTLADPSNWDKAHEKIEASLLAETLDALLAAAPNGYEEDSAHAAFHNRYASAFAAEFGETPTVEQAAKFRATRITDAADTRARERPSSTLRIDELAGTIDLTAY